MRPGIIVRQAQAVALILAAMMADALLTTGHAQELRIESDRAETVYSWSSQRCDDNAIPDSPARALRLPNRGILIMATHYNNRVLMGTSFSDIKPDCRYSAAGHETADPAMFDDRFWVQAVWPLNGGRILGLASHEFHGKRHPGSCSMDPKLRVRCWYSSIVATEASADAPNFKLLPLPTRIVAAPPVRYSSDGPPRSGFFTTSNIVRRDDFLYILVYQEGVGGEKSRGNCLFRAEANAPLMWKALAEDGTWRAFPNPYLGSATADRPHGCMTIGKRVFAQAVRSMIYLEPLRQWVAVFSKRSLGPDGGVYYTTSADLVQWSNPTLLFQMREPWADPKGCGTYYAYPSLIDHKSDSPAFDSGGGDIWLYLTRFNFENCRKALNRDLVRYKVRLQ
jgi:hypothetical protein